MDRLRGSKRSLQHPYIREAVGGLAGDEGGGMARCYAAGSGDGRRGRGSETARRAGLEASRGMWPCGHLGWFQWDPEWTSDVPVCALGG